MTAILKKVGVVGALAMAVSMSAGAQVQNSSDFLITGISNSSSHGGFAPGRAGNGRGRGRGGGNIPPGIASRVMNDLNGGSITSPLTGNAITGAPVTNVAALMGGSPSGVTSVTNSLTGSGIPAALVGALVQALSGLGNNPSLAQVIAAAQAFNALVSNAGTPDSALDDPELLVIHAALMALLAGS